MGNFITLEGGEAAGKTTQALLLAAALRRRGYFVLNTREPGGCDGAELLRKILLDGSMEWSPSAETLLHFAARAEHCAKVIRPTLNSGMWVISDRFYDSTMAYQGYGQGADRNLIAEQTRLLGLDPDLTLILEVSPAVAVNRLAKRAGTPDRYERKDPLFHSRVAEGYRLIAHANPDRCAIIGADADVDAVHASIMAAVEKSGLLTHSEEAGAI